MRIAIAINRSWNIFNFREGLVRTLLKEGHSVLAVAPQDEYTEKLKDWGCSFEPLSMQATGANPISELVTVLRLRRILKRNQIDVLLTYTIKLNIYGIVAARSLGIPCICNVSGLGTAFLWKGWVSRIAQVLYRLTFTYATHIFFQNEEDRGDFLRIVRVPIDKTGVLPGSGIDLRRYVPTNYEPGGASTSFLMISRLLIDKGVREYVDAAEIVRRQYPDATFVLVGGLDTSHKRSIDPDWLSIQQSKGTIHYHPHTDDVPLFIGKSDVVVLPSYREGTPRTLLEGAAMARPLITTDVPGCREVVKDTVNGYLCVAKDPEDLADKMISFINLSRADKMKMAAASRRLVEEKYDEQLVIRAYLDRISALKI